MGKTANGALVWTTEWTMRATWITLWVFVLVGNMLSSHGTQGSQGSQRTEGFQGTQGVECEENQ
ncbi:unnamed protein product [Brassica rapa subsp. narinosa]